jgi:hypothetical protein
MAIMTNQKIDAPKNLVPGEVRELLASAEITWPAIRRELGSDAELGTRRFEASPREMDVTKARTEAMADMGPDEVKNFLAQIVLQEGLVRSIPWSKLSLEQTFSLNEDNMLSSPTPTHLVEYLKSEEGRAYLAQLGIESTADDVMEVVLDVAKRALALLPEGKEKIEFLDQHLQGV